jgi:hypothetical protein
MTSASLQVWGASGAGNNGNPNVGGSGGYAEGALAVTASQTLHVIAGEGGENHPTSSRAFLNGGGGPPNAAGGGGLAGVFAMPSPQLSHPAPVPNVAPNVYVVAGSGGAAGGGSPSAATGGHGGAGGGLTGCHGTGITEQTNRYAAGGNAGFGGGGSQTTGGQGGADPLRTNGSDGAFLKGADNAGGDAMEAVLQMLLVVVDWQVFLLCLLHNYHTQRQSLMLHQMFMLLQVQVAPQVAVLQVPQQVVMVVQVAVLQVVMVQELLNKQIDMRQVVTLVLVEAVLKQQVVKVVQILYEQMEVMVHF